MTVTPHWYLSGGATNSDPTLSIGGAKSSVQVSSTELDSVFDDTTGDEAASGYTDYRLLYVQNDGDTDWVAPVGWFTFQPRNPASPYTVNGDTISAAMAAAGKNAPETAIANDHTAPADVTFANPSTKGTGVALTSPDYAAGDYIGVWLRRVVPSSQSYSSGNEWSYVVEGDDA